MSNQNDNRLRSIGQLAVVGGWFEQEANNPSRYSLHLNATFKEERLGGIESSNIHFRVRLEKCEIVVVLPERGVGFKIDQKTLARTAPSPSVTLSDKSQKTSTGSVGVDVGLENKVPFLKAISSFARKESSESQVENNRTVPKIETLNSMTHDGHVSWIVTPNIGSLLGSLWNPVEEPRFTLMDTRPSESGDDDKIKNLPPMALVEVRCKREDITIYDIKFKDLEKQGVLQNRENQEIRLRAAEAFLRTEIQKQRLNVGDIQDRFSDLTLTEYVVPLFQ